MRRIGRLGLALTLVVQLLWVDGSLGEPLEPLGSEHSEPGMAESCANPKGCAQDARNNSSVVYPLWSSTLAEVHPSHTGIACVDCHTQATLSVRADDNLFPTMEVCTTCHADPAETCDLCHTEYRDEPPTFPNGETAYRAVSNPPTLTRPTGAKLTFSHRIHLASGADCQSCHGEMSTDSPTSNATLPSMQRCIGCHEEQGAATQECAGCHLSDASGRLQTSFGSGELVPTESASGGDHRFDFVRDHSLAAKVDGEVCETCHQPASCERCHDGVLRPQEIHPPNYTLMHGMDSLSGETDCSTCHMEQDFCVECHEGTRVGETLRPPPGASLHPPGFVEDPSSESFHGEEARRSIEACVSCHSEATCIGCHSVIEPHGGDFLDRCGEMLKQNQTACAKCHQDVAALRGPCGE